MASKTSPAKTSVKVATISAAAKDDVLGLSEDGANADGGSLIDVLANDPGSASVYSLGTPTTDPLTGNVAVNTTQHLSFGAGNEYQGLLYIQDGKVYFDLDANESVNSLSEGETTSFTFVYVAKMANGALSAANVTVTVTGSNDAPEITSVEQAGAVQEDVTLSDTGTVTATDVDHDAVLTFSGSETGDFGSFTVDADGNWTYELDNAAHQDLSEGQTEEETFTVTVTDNHGAAVTQDVTITVEGTNDGPQGEAETVLDDGIEDTVYTLTDAQLLAGFTDPDSDGELHVENLAVANGTVTDNGDGTYSVAFDANYNGLAQVTYNVVDNHDAAVAASLDLAVTAVQDLAVEDSDNSTDEDTAVDGSVGGTTTSGGDLTYAVADGPANGTLVLNDDGSYTYTPDADYNGTDSFDVTVTDGDAGEDATVTVNLTINAVNDAPVITSNGGGETASVSVVENTTAVTTVGATDVDAGASIAYSIFGGDDADKFDIDPVTGALTFKAAPDFEVPGDVGANNVYDVVVRASDGTDHDDQAIAVTVTDVSEGPVGEAPTNIAFKLDTSAASAAQQGNLGAARYIGLFNAVDADSSSWTYTLGGTGASSFTIDAATGLLKVGDANITAGALQTFVLDVTAEDSDHNTYTETFYVNVGTNGDDVNVLSVHAASDIDFGLNGGDRILGGAGDDALVGGAANDTLNGEAGHDELFGGDGKDTFAFTSYGAANSDTVLDFNATGNTTGPAENRGDAIQLDKSVFVGLTGSTLAAGNFAANVGGNAADGNDFITFDTATGKLYYDADGNGAGAKELIATLTVTAGTFDVADILV